MLQQIIVYAIIAIFIGISQSAGIGGGPILNICLMLGFGLSAKDSMSVTYIFLMGGSFSSILSNFKKKLPNQNKFLMDYDLIIITLPMSATGALFGTVFNHFISEFIVTILFTILLSYLSYNTYVKLKTFKETEKLSTKVPLMNKQQILDKDGTQMKQIKSPHKGQQEQQIYNSYTRTNSPQMQQIIDYENNPLPKDKIKVISFVFLYTVIVLLTKGDSNFDSIIGIDACTFGTYVIIFIHLILSYLSSKSMAMQVQKRQDQKQRIGYTIYGPGQKMNSSKMWNCIISGFGAGVVGGTLGIGGAIILVPVWISLGVDRTVAPASSGPLIFFSALVSFMMALLQDSYQTFSILVFYFVLAFLGAWGIKRVVKYLIETYNMQSMIFILLLITMVSSLVVLLPFQLYKYFQDSVSFMQFGHLC